MDETVYLEGPVELVGGRLVLRIPLAVGGCDLVACSNGISEIDGEDLKIFIPERIAELLQLHEGSVVQLDNRSGKLNIGPVSPLAS